MLSMITENCHFLLFHERVQPVTGWKRVDKDLAAVSITSL